MTQKVKNPIARSLSEPKFKQRVIKPRKGKGSYSRKGRKVAR